MVSKPTKKRKTVKNNSELAQNAHTKHRMGNKLKLLVVILIFVAAVSVSFLVNAIIVIVNRQSNADDINDTTAEVEPEKPEEPEEAPEPSVGPSKPTTSEKPEKIDFQPVIDAWVNSVAGDKGVMIYDLDRNEIVGEYNAWTTFNTASLYKLFVVMEGYRKVSSGEWMGNDPVRNARRTILECLDLAIRESNSSCAEGLWAMIGRDELDNTVMKDFGIMNTSVSNLQSNANDITVMMKIFYKHPDITSNYLIEKMWDSFLNQPETEYNWRQGLPSGFSDKIKVYNKVGWDYNADDKYWNLYHDTAIIETDKGRHFIVTVMTHKVPFTAIRKLASQIEALL